MESFNPPIEKKQTPEEIESILKQALEKEIHVNLDIVDSSGKAVFTPDLIVAKIEGQDLMITYIADDGDVGELIPLSLARVKKAELI